MFTLHDNQYLPRGFGHPAETYYYFVNERGRIVDYKTLEPYRGKDMRRYAMKSKPEAEAYLEAINNPTKPKSAEIYHKVLNENQYTIKITGSGTYKEIAIALKRLVHGLNPEQEPDRDLEYEDATLMTEIKKEE